MDEPARPAGRHGRRLLAGPFLFDMACAAVAGLLIVAFLRPDPLLVARRLRADSLSPGAPAPVRAEPRERAGVPRLAGLAPTVAALVLAHATMVAVMVMTPLEMHREGATHTAIGAVISVHFLGMYAFAPLSGLLADRAGVRPALVAGGGTLALSLAVSAGLFGTSGLTHGLGLFLLGLGWSVCTVAASSDIAARSVADTRIQGAADTAMTLVSAGAAVAAGPLMAVWGFAGLIALATVFTAGVLVAATRVRPVGADAPRPVPAAPRPAVRAAAAAAPAEPN